MKSRITIDVDHDNQPIIKIEYSPSEDVRDKLVKKFMETFESTSCWANFFFTSANSEPYTATSLVRPIPPAEVEKAKNEMEFYLKERPYLLAKLNGKKELPTPKE